MINIDKLAVFDIETAGGYATYTEMKADNPKLAQLWDKRCEYLRDRYANNKDMSNEELYPLKAGLSAEFGKVVCVTFGVVQNGQNKIKSCCDFNERAVLEWADTMIRNTDGLGMSLAGHTIKRFDIPFLWKRFLFHKMKPPYLITNWNKKPWEQTHFDLPDFWSNGAWQEGFASLDLMTNMFGFASPKDTMEATRVHDTFWKERDLATIQKYCEGDVAATANVIAELSEIVNPAPVSADI